MPVEVDQLADYRPDHHAENQYQKAAGSAGHLETDEQREQADALKGDFGQLRGQMSVDQQTQCAAYYHGGGIYKSSKHGFNPSVGKGFPTARIISALLWVACPNL